ncbi:FUSC family protein [Labrys wisconsinensis]|uniref:Membrane protein YccC n=1 Tax=Labrys wisconsinensis TaxID=425677 RepID=A0ABU0JGC6_9HYPH|nr:FUSC family protein [Labrys wisconsinensis]MDQ0473347.1 putative membrane protein YccC [Labrys wisconsinensis]
MLGVPWLLMQLQPRKAEVRLALRVTLAAVLALVIANLVGLPQSSWAAITAVIVTQASLGASLKAAGDRAAGTLAGAMWGAAVAALLPVHGPPPDREIAMVVALAPTAFLAAVRPSFRIAPITALIVLLPTGQVTGSPLIYALERVVEIMLGIGTGIAVALLVLPSRAHALLLASAAKVVELNAELMTALVEGLVAGEGRPGLTAIHARIRAALKQVETVADEAARERRGHFTGRADPEPLLRTLYRLRHDLVMIGRAASRPLPGEVATALTPRLTALRDASVALLQGTAEALRRADEPPGTEAFEASLKAYVAEMDALRAGGRTRDLASEDVGALYALRFSFEQLALDLRDLVARAGDHAAPALTPRERP